MILTESVSRELTWIIASLWGALFIGWLINDYQLTLIGYLIFFLLRHLYSINRFELWLKGNARAPYPPASGSWSELGYLAARKQRSLEKLAELQVHKYQQLQAASMSIPDAIISIDPNGKIEWFNAAAKRILQLRRTDVSRSLETLLRTPEFLAYLKQENYQEPLILTSFKGVQRVRSVSIFEYYQHHKLIVIKDIHELYNLAQIRKDFVANASHELRTPLTVFTGYLEMMLEMKSQDPTWDKPMQQMNKQAQRMQAIINDLLTLSAMESETLTEEKQIVNVPAILMGLQQNADLISSDRHQFIFEVDNQLNIIGYPTPLTSVFTNLISNAVRYTPEEGSIKVRWFENKKGVFFEVEDTGIGIAQDQIPRITERFYRVDTARSRDTGGTGLGLAIVKHILERHGAVLTVESQIRVGSKFTCRFPLQLKATDGLASEKS